jgi:hypothetical protein
MQRPPQHEEDFLLPSEEQEVEETEEPPLLTLYRLSDWGTEDEREFTEYPLAEEGRIGPV